jgi:hypothetical protein
MNEQLATFFERMAGKKAAQEVLRRLGLDPRQFILFLGLFRTLSEREELAGSIGVNRFNLSYLALYAAALGMLPWTLVAFGIGAAIHGLSSWFVDLSFRAHRQHANLCTRHFLRIMDPGRRFAPFRAAFIFDVHDELEASPIYCRF